MVQKQIINLKYSAHNFGKVRRQHSKIFPTDRKIHSL